LLDEYIIALSVSILYMFRRIWYHIKLDITLYSLAHHIILEHCTLQMYFFLDITLSSLSALIL